MREEHLLDVSGTNNNGVSGKHTNQQNSCTLPSNSRKYSVQHPSSTTGTTTSAKQAATCGVSQENNSSKRRNPSPNSAQPSSAQQPSYPFQEVKPPPPEPTTWIHDIFQGVLTSETVCLTCETVRRKDENFLDLSLDIVENNCSITHCLRKFSHTETLNSDHKFFCDTCCSKQEARKRMRLKKLPQVLAIHLKRFKFQESLGRYTKLAYRVVYPLQLRLFNTVSFFSFVFFICFGDFI